MPRVELLKIIETGCVTVIIVVCGRRGAGGRGEGICKEVCILVSYYMMKKEREKDMLRIIQSLRLLRIVTSNRWCSA
jgi:hypothetical protein